MDKVVFIKAVICARVLQLFYHNAHNLVTGESFFADHAFFNEAYLALEETYDKLAEQYIATFGTAAFETKTIAIIVAEHSEEYEVEKMCCCDKFKAALELEDVLYKELVELNKEATLGLKNMIGGISEQADVRKYKMKQRLQDLEEEE